MSVSTFIPGIVSGINNTAEFRVADLALKGLQVHPQFFPEPFEVRQEFLAVRLDLLTNLILFLRSRCMVQFYQQPLLLLQILVAGLVKRHDKCFNVVGDTPQIAQQIAIIAPVLGHDCWWCGAGRVRA